MAREDPPGGVPDLDPFGANDPAWERYEGVSGLRRLAQSRARGRDKPYRRPRRDLFAAMVVGSLGLAVLIGAIVGLLWLFSLVVD